MRLLGNDAQDRDQDQDRGLDTDEDHLPAHALDHAARTSPFHAARASLPRVAHDDQHQLVPNAPLHAVRVDLGPAQGQDLVLAQGQRRGRSQGQDQSRGQDRSRGQEAVLQPRPGMKWTRVDRNMR